ncbi:MAG: hypothetical protein Q9197_000914 [Variospora fuerteventurae]
MFRWTWTPRQTLFMAKLPQGIQEQLILVDDPSNCKEVKSRAIARDLVHHAITSGKPAPKASHSKPSGGKKARWLERREPKVPGVTRPESTCQGKNETTITPQIQLRRLFIQHLTLPLH